MNTLWNNMYFIDFKKTQILFELILNICLIIIVKHANKLHCSIKEMFYLRTKYFPMWGYIPPNRSIRFRRSWKSRWNSRDCRDKRRPKDRKPTLKRFRRTECRPKKVKMFEIAKISIVLVLRNWNVWLQF